MSPKMLGESDKRVPLAAGSNTLMEPITHRETQKTPIQPGVCQLEEYTLGIPKVTDVPPLSVVHICLTKYSSQGDMLENTHLARERSAARFVNSRAAPPTRKRALVTIIDRLLP